MASPSWKKVFLFENNEFQIRSLTPADVTPEYVESLNDEGTSQYLNQRNSIITLESQKKYISEILEDPDRAIFGVFNNSSRLLASSGIQNICSPEVWMGIVVLSSGDRGKGLGSFLIKELSKMIFESAPHIREIHAGIELGNEPSKKAFEKAGFHVDRQKKIDGFEEKWVARLKCY